MTHGPSGPLSPLGTPARARAPNLNIAQQNVGTTVNTGYQSVSLGIFTTNIEDTMTKEQILKIENMLYWLRHAYELIDDLEDQDTLEKVIEEGEQLLKGGAK